MPKSLLVFAVSFTPECLILGRLLESRTPLKEFFFKLLLLKCVCTYLIFKLQKKIDIKKIDIKKIDIKKIDIKKIDIKKIDIKKIDIKKIDIKKIDIKKIDFRLQIPLNNLYIIIY